MIGFINNLKYEYVIQIFVINLKTNSDHKVVNLSSQFR